MDETRTLTEIEGEDWGDPDFDSSLVTRVHKLRFKPLCDFTIEDLRIAIGQSVGLPHLLPVAIAHLESYPLAEGDFFPGDLLTSVLRVAESFWELHPAIRSRAVAVATNGCDLADDDQLRDACARFVARGG
jgi:hypothetical protein